MSELFGVVCACISGMISACSIALKFGMEIRKLNKSLSANTRWQNSIQSAGFDIQTAARLTVLNHALQSESLKPLRDDTIQLIAPSTARVINTIDTGQALDKTITQSDISIALSDLTDCVQKAHDNITVREQQKIRADIDVVLQKRGYITQMQPIPLEKRILVKAQKDDLVIAARINAKSDVNFDFAGFRPGKCTEERKAVISELRDLGYVFTNQKQVIHNRREGGEIIREIEKGFSNLDDHLSRLNIAKTAQTKRVRRG